MDDKTKTIDGKVDEYENDRLDSNQSPERWVLEKIAELELRLEQLEEMDR